MAVKEFPAGEKLFQSDQPVAAIHLIAKGSVIATYPGGEFRLTKGDVIGICEMHIGSYYITYQTEEATALAPYPCTKVQLAELMGSNPEMADRIVTSCTDSSKQSWISINWPVRTAITSITI